MTQNNPPPFFSYLSHIIKRLVKENFILACIIPGIAYLLFIFTLYSVKQPNQPKYTAPFITPSITPFPKCIAGLGQIEAESQNLEIAPALPGIVSTLNVEVGDHITPQSILCIIDDQPAQTRLKATKAQLCMAEIDWQDKAEQAKRYNSVTDKRAISKDTLAQKKYAAQMAAAKVDDLKAQLESIQVEIERLHIKSPIHGTVLRINKRPGEYVGLSNPVFIVGNTDTFHVRVEFDETEALHIHKTAKAIGRLRGYAQHAIPLRFVRKEPYLKSKSQLSGEGSERFDTRVQEIIYAIDTKAFKGFIGQQMNVYVERP